MAKTYDHAWQQVRRIVLHRDRYECQIRGPRCTQRATEADHIVALAKAHAPAADWAKPDISDIAQLPSYLEAHPTNLQVLQMQGEEFLTTKQWEQAATIGQRLIDLSPQDTSTESGYWLKARALRHLQRIEEEATLLRTMAAQTGDVLPIYLRLMEIDHERQAWPDLQTHAARALALNPFLPAPNEALARAAQATGDTPTAILIYQRLLHLSPANPAQVRYQLATLLKPTDQPQAKRHLLDALAMAPRYQEAQKLLLDMQ